MKEEKEGKENIALKQIEFLNQTDAIYILNSPIYKDLKT